MLTDAPGAIQYAKIDIATATTHAIVATPASTYCVRILGMFVIAAGAVTITLEDEDGTDLSGAISLAANGGFVLQPSGLGYQQTPDTKGLNILLSDAIQVSGTLTYQIIRVG